MKSRTSLIPLLAAVGVQALSGGTKCSGGMCVSAVVQTNSTVQYTMTLKESQVGWMALGFGSRMINTPIVLMWIDPSSGETVLSQRQTSTYVMPKVASSPDRVATALQYKTSATSSETTLSFEIPSTTDTRQNLIWAYSKTAPSTPSDPSSSITQHDDNGILQLSLTDTVDGGTTGSGDSNTGDDVGSDLPLSNTQKMLVAHAIIMTIAFLLVLPFGAIFVRLTRTWIPGRFWFATHWSFQWLVAGALITIGFALGVSSVQQEGKSHFTGDHKKWGLVLVILYVLQCTLGGVIHFIKSKHRIRRPPQNYLHACLGLIIIGGSFWQVHDGYSEEWPKTQVRQTPKGINIAFIIWAVLIPLTYAAGLAFLPRQYKQERDARSERVTEMAKLSPA